MKWILSKNNIVIFRTHKNFQNMKVYSWISQLSCYDTHSAVAIKLGAVEILQICFCKFIVRLYYIMRDKHTRMRVDVISISQTSSKHACFGKEFWQMTQFIILMNFLSQ